MSQSYTVLLVHGIFDTSAVLKPLRRFLESQAFRVIAPDLTPCDGSRSIAFLAKQLAVFIEQEISHNHAFSIVAFSMGGLVARYYLQTWTDVARVDSLITLGSPHNGSVLAFFRRGEGFRDLRQGSDLLKFLQAGDARLSSLPLVSIYTPFDLMIIPFTSSRWRIAKTLSLPIPIHCGLLSSPKAHLAVLNAINEARQNPEVAILNDYPDGKNFIGKTKRKS